MVKGWSGNEKAKPSESPAQIGVDKEALYRADKHDDERYRVQSPARHRLSQPQRVHGDKAAEANEDDIQRMGAGADQPVHLLGAVMGVA